MNTREYIENCLYIRDKKTRTIPFHLNPPQEKLYAAMKRQRDAGLAVRLIVLKARQMGFSTLTGGVMFSRCATGKNRQGLIVAHKDEATKGLFEMHKRFLDNLPRVMRPQVAASNGYEIVFDRPVRARSKRPGLGSRIKIATAGGRGVGRGSTIQYLHLSEYAFWPGDPRENYIALMQAVPDDPETIVVIESTANGYNDFKELWDRAVERERRGELDGFLPVFFSWFEMPEYRRPVPPGFTRTTEEQELADTYGLDDEQLCWRRWAIVNNCGGDLDQFRQEYPSCPDEAFLATGTCAFDQKQVVLARNRVRELPWQRGRFRVRYDEWGRVASWKWEEDGKGPVRILRTPEVGVPYVLGADTAGSGQDFFAGQVLDNRTGAQVAVVHQQYGERSFTEQLYCLGKHYNDALVGIEINCSTYPNELIQQLGYKRLYVRQAVDSYTHRAMEKFGFETTTKTRPLIIDGLKDVAKYHMELIADYDTLGEMLTFVYDEQGKPQAEKGKHDDLVMALAIAHFIRTQQSYGIETASGRGRWTEEMWEDYDEASPEERRELIAKWGRPPARR